MQERDSGNGIDSADWSEEVAHLIDHIDHDDLPAQVIAALRRVVPFELAAIFVYRGRSKPLLVCDDFAEARAQSGLANYLDATYVLNPFYQAHLKGIAPGVYRIRDLAPDGFFESEIYKTFKITRSSSEEIGYVTDDWPKHMEEVNIAVRLGAEVTAEIGLHRPVRDGGFDEAHLKRLARIHPIVGAAFRKHWSLGRRAAAAPFDTRIDEAFGDFGCDALSERERQVVRLVLRGHSSDSIGRNLDISVTTVKTHRKRAYAKLGICSQSELLSLFIRSLDRPASVAAPLGL